MANSILTRLIRLFKAGTHDALDTLEDPGRMARQIVRDLAVEIAQCEEVIASVVGDQKVLNSKYENAVQESKNWNDKAEVAVSAGRDDLARAALEQANRAECNVRIFQSSLEKLSPKIMSLKEKLTQLREKKEDAENEAELLDARAKVAHASSRTSRILGSIGENSVDFEKVRDRVTMLEAGADALSELAEEKAGRDIENELVSLNKLSIDERLAELKKRQKRVLKGDK
ncbi:hypothetical protein C9426_24140 [Serratia sp. S1B]|nr:hypothetical protein C9426_24140 [Serratia sp. S1B]